MTKYKQMLRKKGFQLECDFPWLPYTMPSGIVQLESVETGIDEDGLFIRKIYDVDIVKIYINRQLKVDKVY